MSLFAISDLHLALDPAVDKPMDIFDDAWNNHVDRLKNNWEQIVTDNDTVVIPGDISWGIDLNQSAADLKFIESLPGHKVLLRGNHDYWWSSMAKMQGLYRNIDYVQNDCYEGDNFVICGCRGWALPSRPLKDFTDAENKKIYQRELLRLEMSLKEASQKRDGRTLIVATHFPPLDAQHSTTDFTKLFKQYGVDIAIYGHLHHGHWNEALEGCVDGVKYYLVSLDKLDARPVKIL